MDELDYFEMQGDSFVIFDVDEFRAKTKALAIDVREQGVCLLDGEAMEWYYLPFRDGRKRHLKPVT
jgi:hypothetical protein